MIAAATSSRSPLETSPPTKPRRVRRRTTKRATMVGLPLSSQRSSPIDRTRQNAYLANAVEFMDAAEFAAPEAEVRYLSGLALGVELESGAIASSTSLGAKAPPGASPYMSSLYETKLLSKEDEAFLFAQMNYLKCREEMLRRTLSSRTARTELLDEIDWLLRSATTVRNRIVRANLRLVVSVAKRFLDQSAGLHELISDGNISLMKAVEKFDFTRGFRFSTYATWALRYNFSRSVAASQRLRKRYLSGEDKLLESRVDEADDDASSPAVDLQRSVKRLLNRLDRRERAIVAARFGLGKAGEEHTLQQIAMEMGICKERVRQIQIRAMGKLRDLAQLKQLEPLIEAAGE
jgi:RNA polymerase primary sigma factor